MGVWTSVPPYVNPGVCPVLLARYDHKNQNQRTEFHRTFVDDVVEGTHTLARFEGRKVNVKVTARSHD